MLGSIKVRTTRVNPSASKISTARTLTNPVRRIFHRGLRYGFLCSVMFSGRYHTERGAQQRPEIPPMNWRSRLFLVGGFCSHPKQKTNRGRSTCPFSYTQPSFWQIFLRHRQKIQTVLPPQIVFAGFGCKSRPCIVLFSPTETSSGKIRDATQVRKPTEQQVVYYTVVVDSTQ
jgi:hypothetical protein